MVKSFEKNEDGRVVLPPEVMAMLELMGPVREVPRTEAQKNCTRCRGYGLWEDGYPMGPMDAGDGCPTIECPQCKANPNPGGGPEPEYNFDFLRDASMQQLRSETLERIEKTLEEE